MPPGRPLKPTEVKRRNGNPGCRPLPDVSTVSVLPMATQAPEPPAEVGVEGRRLWDRCWDAAITWLSPVSDVDARSKSATSSTTCPRPGGGIARTARPRTCTRSLRPRGCCTSRCPASGSTRPVAPGSGVAEVRRVTALEDLTDVAPGAVSRPTTVAGWPPRVLTPVPAAALEASKALDGVRVEDSRSVRTAPEILD